MGDPRSGRLEFPIGVAANPQADARAFVVRESCRRQVELLQKRVQGLERGVPREDQLGRLSPEGRHDLVGPRRDQRMAAVGLVVQEVVDEEVSRGAVHPPVEVQGALPSPDVEVRVVPDRRTSGQVTPDRPQGDPLPPSLILDRQLLRCNTQIVTPLDEQCPADGGNQGDR